MRVCRDKRDSATPRQSEAAVVGGAEILSDRLQGLAAQEIRPGEQVLLVLKGKGSHALVALERRLLVLKAGFGAGLRQRRVATSFDYRDIIDLEVERGSALTVIWVSSTAFRPLEKEVWQAHDPSRDPFRAANAVPIPTSEPDPCEPFVDWLRQTIAAAENGERASDQERDETERVASLVLSLERLTALRDSGALTEEQFDRAKGRLLD